MLACVEGSSPQTAVSGGAPACGHSSERSRRPNPLFSEMGWLGMLADLAIFPPIDFARSRIPRNPKCAICLLRYRMVRRLRTAL